MTQKPVLRDPRRRRWQEDQQRTGRPPYPLLDKLHVYAGLGVLEVWLFRHGAFDVYRLAGDDYDLVHPCDVADPPAQRGELISRASPRRGEQIDAEPGGGSALGVGLAVMSEDSVNEAAAEG